MSLVFDCECKTRIFVFIDFLSVEQELLFASYKHILAVIHSAGMCFHLYIPFLSTRARIDSLWRHRAADTSDSDGVSNFQRTATQE